MRHATVVSAWFVLVSLAAAGTARSDDAESPPEEDQDESTPPPKSDLEAAADALPTTEEITVAGWRDAVPVVHLTEPGTRDVVGPDVLRGTARRDLNALVQLAPSISSRPYNGGEASAPSISVRGLPDDGLTEYLLVLVDGVPASPLPYGWTAFSFMPVAAERIHAMDITRGAFAVRHSPNTVGGVLNLITDPIPADRTFRMSQTLGSDGYRSTYVSAGGTEDGFGALATYVDKAGDGYRDDGEFTIRDSSVKLRMDTGAGQWVKANVSYFTDAHQAPGGLTRAQYEDDRFGNSRPQNHFNGYRTLVDVAYHAERSRHDWGEAYGSYSYTARRLHALPEVGPPIGIDEWTDESQTAIVGVRGNRRFELLSIPHDLHAGLRAQHERIDSWKIVETSFATGAETVFQDRSYSLYAFSAHVDDTFRPTDALTVVVGVRGEWIPKASGSDELGIDRFDDEFAALLPGADASYELTDRWALFANAHESFRAPQVWGFDFSGADQGLDFEKGKSFEAGTRVKDVCGFDASFAVWRVDFDDVATFDKGYYDNFGRIVAEGTDVVADWSVGSVDEALAGLRLRGSWTHQDSRLREGPFDGNRTPYAWDDKFVVGARYETEDGWMLAVDGTYFGSTTSDEAGSPENAAGTVGPNRSVMTWDARLGKRFELSGTASIDLGVGVTNLFDTERFIHSRGGFFGGGRVAYAPLQAYFSVGVDVRF